MSKTVKFGGTSLADGQAIKHACSLVEADPERKYMVVSAPGKRFKEDTKVTDLLLKCCRLAKKKEDYKPYLKQVRQRFKEIIEELSVTTVDLNQEIEIIEEKLINDPHKSYISSRGEYLNGKIIAAYMKRPFIDAADIICFDGRKYNEEETEKKLKDLPETAVIPGFYGKNETGKIITFSRGGSDITGSIIAKGTNASVYENWTDVSGLLTADPRIVKNPKPQAIISYRELRELSYMGASVLHEDAVFPVKSAGIPIHILNTMRPKDPGTIIVARRPNEYEDKSIAGIAGKKGFSNIQIEKSMMNNEVGFGAKIFNILAENGISYEHSPSSIDTMSVIVNTKMLEDKREKVLQEINDAVHPDKLYIDDNIALVAVVGTAFVHRAGLAARVFQAISAAHVSVRMIDAGFTELTIIVGISDEDYEKTIRAVYDGMKKFM